ncbi:TPA: hypothetical protein SLO92_001352 [Klebsiella pneumoniae]|jgi:hypothetical protein|uniref:hypothetical protein n=1 Tax=Enterobacteriaceae TaxID=543 RepID=UPI000518DEE3|nr:MULTISPECIES: hypothetical protein [Enterobacteriaceae]MBT1873677.1 hypothetical protein [Enterobacter hormaechei subsp. xiangfangensis]HDS9254752.1 hypothetical protein [Klebsiella pneumoniae subsp. pneumoniae]HDU4944080.1 hypothetical protein [Klebsiella pneumoniae subsp. ozaenae]MBG2011289.1 hypothetical protein [Klebsiella pneumoniae]MBZ1557446.1 hypothetical protein [Klebsiella pneumoniae]
MTTKKKSQAQISPELKTYLDNIAAKYKPDPGALKRQIDNAEARYSRTQQFSDIPARLVVKLQSLILDGWRYCPSANSSVLSNATMIAVKLQKPETLIEDELKTLRSRVSNAYHDQLFTAMEREIDELIHEAAQDAQQKAVQQAAAEEAAIRDQLRAALGMVKA